MRERDSGKDETERWIAENSVQRDHPVSRVSPVIARGSADSRETTVGINHLRDSLRIQGTSPERCAGKITAAVSFDGAGRGVGAGREVVTGKDMGGFGDFDSATSTPIPLLGRDISHAGSSDISDEEYISC